MAAAVAASYKTGLQQRLTGRMWALARVTWLSVSALALTLTLHPSALLHSSWLWLTIQIGILIPAWSALGVLSLVPVQILRKKQTRLQPALYQTRLQTLTQLLTSQQTAVTMLAYALSWAALFAVWTQLCRLTSPDPDLSVFLSSSGASTKSRAPQINPRLAYLAGSTAVFACIMGARHSLFQLSVLHFDSAQAHQSIGRRASALFSTRSRDTAVLAVSWSFLWPLLWSSFKRPLLRTFIYPTPFRPFFAALYKQLGLSPSTLLRSGSACLFCGLAWDAINVLLDVYLTQPIVISYLSPTPNATLLDGIQSPDQHTQHMAYLELVQVVTADAKRRKAIFDDVAKDPAALPLFICACLAQLDKDRMQILNPGASPASAPTVTPAPSSEQQKALPSVPVMDGGTIQQPRLHFLDRFARTQMDPSPAPSAAPPARPGSAAPAPGSGTPQQQQVESGVVPSVFRNASSQPAGSAAAPAASQPAAPQSSSSQRSEIVPLLLKKALGEKSLVCQWLLVPLPGPAVRRALPQPEMDAWIAQILSAFLIHSLQEDTYGLAQKELPKTLEGFNQFSAALESLIKMHQDKHEVLQSHVQPVLRQTSNAFSDIVLAFKPFLKEFRFSQMTDTKVKAVLDYR